MNILLVHNSLNDSTSVSGVLKHYALVAREWIARGHLTDFLVASAGFSQLMDLCPQAGRVSSDRVFNASRYLDQTWRYFPAYGWRLLNAHFLRLPRQYDLVYASNFLIFEVYAADVIAKRQRAGLVVKLQHVLHSQPKRESFFDRLFLWTERWAARIANQRADLMMCLSDIVGADYLKIEQDLGLQASKVSQVGCGLDFSEIDAVPEMEKRYDVVFLGRVHEQKGVFELPEVWARVVASVPEAKLVVIGEGPHRLKIQQFFEEKDLDASVTFVGGVPEKRKNALLAASRIGLSLSYEEGWGLSVMECLAAGLPVVAYDLPVFRSVFSEQLEMVQVGDAQAAAKQLIDLVRHPERQRDMGERGRQFVRRFDYRAVAQEELALMEEVVRRRRGEST
ncbi:MAG: N-acetyl-alpha-D-glucosaminyl L-malate synthase [Verrucomicrobia subdivision 3 bacterium]|nr:N-acetyl-alpha-D-glucosaminyl L-malate synthase [Limisphaerales bacterium]MCS1413360.1 N-acetyl-alpha-D-glucosaminyl L-malate synthase [Limisphaerales bacterium]